MTREEHLLIIGMEECNETSQRLSKALRFGLEQIQQDTDDKPWENPQAYTNKERIIIEYHELIATMEMLGIEGSDRYWIDAKKKRIEKYLLKSLELGKLD